MIPASGWLISETLRPILRPICRDTIRPTDGSIPLGGPLPAAAMLCFRSRRSCRVLNNGHCVPYTGGGAPGNRTPPGMLDGRPGETIRAPLCARSRYAAGTSIANCSAPQRRRQLPVSFCFAWLFVFVLTVCSAPC